MRNTSILPSINLAFTEANKTQSKDLKPKIRVRDPGLTLDPGLLIKRQSPSVESKNGKGDFKADTIADLQKYTMLITPRSKRNSDDTEPSYDLKKGLSSLTESGPLFENFKLMDFSPREEAGWNSIFKGILSPFTNKFHTYIQNELKNKNSISLEDKIECAQGIKPQKKNEFTNFYENYRVNSEEPDHLIYKKLPIALKNLLSPKGKGNLNSIKYVPNTKLDSSMPRKKNGRNYRKLFRRSDSVGSKLDISKDTFGLLEDIKQTLEIKRNTRVFKGLQRRKSCQCCHCGGESKQLKKARVWHMFNMDCDNMKLKKNQSNRTHKMDRQSFAKNLVALNKVRSHSTVSTINPDLVRIANMHSGHLNSPKQKKTPKKLGISKTPLSKPTTRESLTNVLNSIPTMIPLPPTFLDTATTITVTSDTKKMRKHDSQTSATSSIKASHSPSQGALKSPTMKPKLKVSMDFITAKIKGFDSTVIPTDIGPITPMRLSMQRFKTESMNKKFKSERKSLSKAISMTQIGDKPHPKYVFSNPTSPQLLESKAMRMNSAQTFSPVKEKLKLVTLPSLISESSASLPSSRHPQTAKTELPFKKLDRSVKTQVLRKLTLMGVPGKQKKYDCLYLRSKGIIDNYLNTAPGSPTSTSGEGIKSLQSSPKGSCKTQGDCSPSTCHKLRFILC